MRAEQPGTPVFRPTLLVVDDEPLVADFVREILEPEGFNIIAADSADTALTLLEKEDANIDLLLTDIRMPGSMDGAQLANMVCQRWPDMPIIVMSGYENAVHRKHQMPGALPAQALVHRSADRCSERRRLFGYAQRLKTWEPWRCE